jgi:PAS domain S-box-containing protein
MTDPNDSAPPDFSDLRRRAEELLAQESLAPEALSPADTARLIHELRVHQIELEMQNDELRQAQARVEESRSKYADLYDFAPVGYLTLDKAGRIVEANLTATTILGVERSRLLGSYFRLFLAEADRRAFQSLLTNFLDLGERRGEFQLQTGPGEGRTMLVNLSFSPDAAESGNRRLSLTDITEQKEAQEKLRLLAKQLLNFQEQERRRIARDLHDELGQSLMALKMQLNAVKRSFKRGREDWKEFDQAIDFVNAIAAQTREICQALRPSALENLGLNGALRQLCAEFRKHYGLEVTEELADLRHLVSSEAQIAVYRIFQECLTNAARHGQASRVLVRTQKRDGAICLTCADDGFGFDLTELRSRGEGIAGLGLAAMEERVRLLNGTVKITSAPGQGTRLDITLPLEKKRV